MQKTPSRGKSENVLYSVSTEPTALHAAEIKCFRELSCNYIVPRTRCLGFLRGLLKLSKVSQHLLVERGNFGFGFGFLLRLHGAEVCLYFLVERRGALGRHLLGYATVPSHLK